MTLPTTPSLRLDGKRALVTGAGRGLGAAMATALAEAGAAVVLVARSAAQVEAVAGALSEAGYAAEGHALDVTDRCGFDALVRARGPLDVFVNNAGTNRARPFLELTEEDYDTVTDLNVRAAFFCAQSVVRGMVAGGRGGSIINVSSQMGHVGGPNRTLYAATKHAMEGFTKSMAIELGPHRIRVNTLCPTFVRTELTQTAFADPVMSRIIAEKIVLGRPGELEDVMGPVVFLASDASALMTGAALLVDGGWTAA